MGTVDLIFVAAGAFVLVLNLTVLASLYKRCRPNEALIISGFQGEPAGKHGFRIVQSGGAVVLPLIQKLDRISLEIYPIEINTPTPLVTVSGESVFVTGVAQIKVSSDEDGIAKAAEHFLSKEPTAMTKVCYERLLHHMRAIVALMEVEELRQGVDAFAHKVQLACLPDLSKMGLTLVSLSVEDVRTYTGQSNRLESKQSTWMQ